MVLMLILLCQQSVKGIEIADIYSEIVHSAITIEDKTYWITIEGRGTGRSDKLYRFDHATKQILVLPSDYTDLKTSSRLVPLDTGIALVQTNGEVFFLDREGRLQERFLLTDLPGCPSNLRIVEVQTEKEGSAVVTFRDLEEVTTLFMAKLDLEQRTFEVAFVKRETDGDGFWLHRDNLWFFINSYNGEIAELDDRFRTKKIVVPALTPIRSVTDSKVADMLKLQGLTPFLSLLRSGSLVGSTSYFWRFHEQTKSGLVLHQLALERGRFSVVNHSKLIIARFKGGTLEYDREEREFKLITQ